MSYKKISMVLSLICVLFCADNIQADSRYVGTEITLNSNGDQLKECEVAKLNNQGSVMGNGWGNNCRDFLNFIWDQEHGMQIFGDPYEFIEFIDFNDAGKVVGLADESGPFFWDADGGFQFIALPKKAKGSHPLAINNSNQVLLRTDDGKKNFLWESQHGAVPVVLPTQLKGHELWARTMNDKGQILFLDFKDSSSFVVEGDKIIKTIPKSKGFFNMGLALNNLGDVVGLKIPDKKSLRPIGMIWTADGLKFEVALENAEVTLTAINDRGEAVGDIWKMDSDENSCLISPFLWTREEGVIYLNTLIDSHDDWVLIEALAINNRGQILVRGYKNNPSKDVILILLTPDKFS